LVSPSQRLIFTGAALGTIFVAFVLFGTVWFMEWLGKEPIIKFTITVPNPPGDGRVLENPSIKV